LDVDYFKKNEVENNVPVSPAQEYSGASFILVVQTTKDIDKYKVVMIVQQVYKCSHKEYPRRRAHRREMKFDPYLPIKLKCPKLFEVKDQINLVLLLYDELVKRRRNCFGGPSIGQFLNDYVV